MNAPHPFASGHDSRALGRPVLCPGCQRAEYRSALIDESPFAEAAAQAQQLCFFGEVDAARELLMRLAAVRVENTIRLPWLCCICSARFDG